MLVGVHYATKVGCIQIGVQKTCSGWGLIAGKPVEEELEMVWAWLYDQDLLMDQNGKELPLE